ncbi:MAG: rod-binding protein [Alphaproteobacteria bacterium]
MADLALGLATTPVDLAALAAPPTPKATASPTEAAKTAEDFEAFFLWQVFDSMVAGIPTDGAFGGGQAEQVYRSLLSQEFARVVARGGGVGIADYVQREILRLQEVD